VLVIQDGWGFTNLDSSSSHTRSNMPKYPFLHLGHKLIKLAKVWYFGLFLILFFSSFRSNWNICPTIHILKKLLYVEAINCWKRFFYETFLEASSLLKFFGACPPMWNVMNFFWACVQLYHKKQENKFK